MTGMRPELLAIGETMAMVAPLTGDSLVDAEQFRLDAGGAESNVAAHVAALGHRAAWFSRLGADARIIHLMGEPRNSRHLVVANEQAVISPSWSVHSGVGTSSYAFVWAMAGENQAFDDMDAAPVTELK